MDRVALILISVIILLQILILLSFLGSITEMIINQIKLLSALTKAKNETQNNIIAEN